MPQIKTLPRDDATNGWTRTLPERIPRPAVKGETTADLLIIGAGFAGLAAAWHYARLRPNERVVLVDAQCVGDGASGRNSGFVLGVRHKAEDADVANLEPSLRVRRISQAAIGFLSEIVTSHQIRCDWKHDGMYIASSGPKGDEALENLAKELELLGEPHRMLGASDVLGETGTPHYRTMLFSPNCILMQPGKLVRGLADALPPNVALHELSPVTRIAYGATIHAETPQGSVRAPKLVLAVNAFAPEFGFFKRRVFPVRLYVSLTRPLTAAERKLYTVKPWGILPAIHTVSPTMRFTEDHRLMMRSGYALNLAHDPGVSGHGEVRKVHQSMVRERFPMLPDLDIEHTWAGFVCLSRNFAHGLSIVADNVFTAVCENGVGATKSTISGVCAADLALGERNPLTDDLGSFGTPQQLPPSPFFETGFTLKRRYESWRDRHES